MGKAPAAAATRGGRGRRTNLGLGIQQGNVLSNSRVILTDQSNKSVTSDDNDSVGRRKNGASIGGPIPPPQLWKGEAASHAPKGMPRSRHGLQRKGPNPGAPIGVGGGGTRDLSLETVSWGGYVLKSILFFFIRIMYFKILFFLFITKIFIYQLLCKTNHFNCHHSFLPCYDHWAHVS